MLITSCKLQGNDFSSHIPDNYFTHCFGDHCYVEKPLTVLSESETIVMSLELVQMVFISCELYFFFSKNSIFIYFQREERSKKQRDTDINSSLPLMCYIPPETWPRTQACALNRNRTGDPLVHRPALNSLSHTSWGYLL